MPPSCWKPLRGEGLSANPQGVFATDRVECPLPKGGRYGCNGPAPKGDNAKEERLLKAMRAIQAIDIDGEPGIELAAIDSASCTVSPGDPKRPASCNVFAIWGDVCHPSAK